MLPPPVKETRVTKEETVDKLITGQDSSDDILPLHNNKRTME